MSQFDGSGRKVRCIDCTLLRENICQAKEVGVAPRKHRLCSVYKFSGNHQNRTPLEATYIPSVDRYTRRMIRKLIAAGVVPSQAPDGKTVISIPRTTVDALGIQSNTTDQQQMTGAPNLEDNTPM